MTAMLLAGQTVVTPVVSRASAVHQTRAFRPCRPSLRRVVMMAERPRQDDNPADEAFAKLEDNLEGAIQASKENSGLFKDTISQQPGNKTGKKGSPIDESGQAGEAMSPGGLVPEITNGRGAMAAMLIAFVKELTTGKPVAEQIKSDPIFILAVFGTIIVASIIPVFRGADLNQKGAGPFTPRAEIWNGRLAMVAFAMLLIVEGFKGGPGLVFGGGAPPTI